MEWRSLRLEFRGQLRAVHAASDGPIRNIESDTFDVARRRLSIDGTIGRDSGFQAEAEMNDDDPVRDLYLDYRAARAAQIRGGRFKLPFGLEENIPHAKLEFVRRSLMSDRLAPGRDDGLTLYGRVGRMGTSRRVRARWRERAAGPRDQGVRGSDGRGTDHDRTVPRREDERGRSGDERCVRARHGARRVSGCARADGARRVVLRC